VPCSNGVLVPGSLVSVRKFPGVQFRILEMHHHCSAQVFLEAEDAEDALWRISIPLVGVALMDPRAAFVIPGKPPAEGHALTYWALSSLKDILRTGIRASTSRRMGVMTVSFSDYDLAVATKCGIVRSGPADKPKYTVSKYSVTSADPARTTAALESTLGDRWDLILDNTAVIYQITFRVQGTRFYKTLKASVRTVHSQGDPFDATTYREITRGSVQHAIHAPIPDDSDNDSDNDSDAGAPDDTQDEDDHTVMQL
jgi:hypothetical protein